MINLCEQLGTNVFSGKGNNFTGVSHRQIAELQQKYPNAGSVIDMDLLREKIQNRDSLEIKGTTPVVLASENYNDILKVTKMPKSVFGDNFGYQMQKDIAGCMRRYYAGEISDEEVKSFFYECCSSMRAYHSQARHTTGMDKADNIQIVSEVYELFAKENQRAARNANYEEGQTINSQYGADSRQDDWSYYNADYYYQCEDTHELLRGAVEEIAEEWELGTIDTDEIERNSTLTLDGGFDFNSGWNFIYRNQVGRSSMEEEMTAPPKGFKFFYKESGGADGKGTVRLWAGGRSRTVDVPFYICRDSLKGQIFNLSTLTRFSEKDTGDYQAYNRFLKNFSIFTRWYSFESRINNRFGSLVPDYE